MIVIRYIFGFYIFPYIGERVISPKYQGAARIDKVNRFGHTLIKLCFFVTISIYGYIVLKDKEYTPWILGGSGDITESFPEEFPYVSYYEDVAYYFLWGLSYHVMSLVYHLALPKKPDFMEMFLHHICTIFLIAFSYMSGYLRIGSLIFFLHDVTDVASYLMKTSVDTQSTTFNKMTYTNLLVSWGIGRLFIFPVFLIKEAMFSPRMVKIYIHGYYFFNIMLVILFCLHVYWYCLFLKMGFAYATRGVIKDAQAEGFTKDDAIGTIEKKDEQKK
jgi:ceramide synthetase